jgi:cysteine desulfurase / selenocysteine lyase
MLATSSASSWAKERLFRDALPFLYGGDMIAEGQVAPDRVAYNELPWKYAAGTPNILGVIVSAQALRLIVDLVSPGPHAYFNAMMPLPHDVVGRAMGRVRRHSHDLTAYAMSALSGIDGVTIYGPPAGSDRAPLVAFNVAGMNPFTVAEELDRHGIESRAGCHCATLAHHALRLDPPASCRLSFYLYNTRDEVDRAADAVAKIAHARGAARGAPVAP